MSYTIYHNPRCSKSRQTLSLLREKGIEPSIRLYLTNPLNKEELSNLLLALGMPADKVIRRNEAVFKENFKGKDLTEEQWVEALCSHPKLLERPIVTNSITNKAVVGRPPENINQLL